MRSAEYPYKAVLSGLTVIRPQDSLAYIEENLGDLKDLEYSEIKWDILIPDELRPKQKLIVPSALDFVLAVSKRRASESSDVSSFQLHLTSRQYFSRLVS
ncbi:uncharacterized protein LOC142348383 isoform X2 [Convolutriloba macropyga]|uniref:uncharacterized protein LOC142348383 isoform X2 n=1 Tax=Convolutriloba macropyga TaxID=536237 RepID=UPI003F520AEA